MIYYFVILLLAFYSFCLQFSKNKDFVKLFSILTPVIILLIGGLRYEVGTDWYSYESIFDGINNMHDLWNSEKEKAFGLSILLVKSITTSYSVFVFFFFAIAFFIKFKILKQLSSDIFLSLIVYVYLIFLTFDVNGIRQGMALGIILLSLKYILDRKMIKFITIIVFASLFHVSAWIFLPFYWIARIKVKPKYLMFGSIVALSFTLPIRNFIENNSYVQLFLTLEKFSRLDTYFENELFGRDVSILSVAVFQRFLIFFLFFINYKKIPVNENFKRLLFNGFFASILIFLFLSFSMDLSNRFSVYYKSLEVFIIPLIISSQKNYLNKLIMLIIFVSFYLLGVNRLLLIPDGGLIPYKTVLW